MLTNDHSDNETVIFIITGTLFIIIKMTMQSQLNVHKYSFLAKVRSNSVCKFSF